MLRVLCWETFAASLLLLLAGFGGGGEAGAAAFHDGKRVGHVEDDLLDVRKDFRFADGCAELRQEGVDLGEGRDDLGVRGEESRVVDGARGDQGCGHIPVAEDHTEPGVVYSADGGHQFIERRGVEFAGEPGTGLAQQGLAAEIEELKIELCGFVGGGHVRARPFEESS
ncbi:MAG TPA: hypothetical protein VIY53_16785 [Acidobacteriaceae bacterium]